MTSRFEGKVALVTGAGSGIGRALTAKLVQNGVSVAGVDLNPTSLESLNAELPGGRFAWAVADVTKRESLGPAVALLTEKLGPIHLLIANAGIGRENSALDFRAADFEAQVLVNLIGVANSVEAVLPGMLQRKTGHLAVLSSLASYRGLPKMAGYCASKAGVSSLFDTLRIELEPLGIDCTTICPGWIRTPLTQNVGVPKPNMMEVDFATERILWAIERRKAHYAFPAASAWQVWLARWLPPRTSDSLLRRLLQRLTRKSGTP